VRHGRKRCSSTRSKIFANAIDIDIHIPGYSIGSYLIATRFWPIDRRDGVNADPSSFVFTPDRSFIRTTAGDDGSGHSDRLADIMKRKKSDSTSQPAEPKMHSGAAAVNGTSSKGVPRHGRTPTATRKRKRISRPLASEDISDDELVTAPVTPCKSPRKFVSSSVDHS